MMLGGAACAETTTDRKMTSRRGITGKMKVLALEGAGQWIENATLQGNPAQIAFVIAGFHCPCMNWRADS